MNDESRRLQEMLERATEPGDEMPADLDAETAALREGWLALGKLLEDSPFASAEPLDRWQATPRPAPQRRRLGVAVAIAASLLIAAGLTLAYRLLDGSNPGQPNAPTLARDDQSTTDSLVDTPQAVVQAPIPQSLNPEPPSLNPEPRTLTPGYLAWDDSLDEEIAAVAQAAALVHDDWYAQAGGLSVIERGLDQIKQDIKDGTL